MCSRVLIKLKHLIEKEFNKFQLNGEFKLMLIPSNSDYLYVKVDMNLMHITQLREHHVLVPTKENKLQF